jgi:hypothetical protein
VHGGGQATFEYPATSAGAKELRAMLVKMRASVQGGGNAGTYGTPDAIADNLLPASIGGKAHSGIKGVRRTSSGTVALAPDAFLKTLTASTVKPKTVKPKTPRAAKVAPIATPELAPVS